MINICKKHKAFTAGDQRGVVLITVLIMGMIITMVALSLVDVTIGQSKRTNDNVYRENANLTAEAGIEQSMYQLNQSSSFGGYASEQEFFNNATQGRGTYQVTVTNGTSSNEKVITSTGRMYRYSSGRLVATRKVRVTVVGTQSAGYSVHTGPGGLILGGSASITNSRVYVNGKITMSGGAKIGTASQPLDVFVAHDSCPSGTSPGSTYPQVCTSGQPISMSGSTTIYGSVCATNQTTSNFGSSKILPGNGGEGLKVGCTAPLVSTPTYDRAAHISRMTTTGSATSSTYNCSTWVNPVGFTRTWPANLRLNGNVNAASSCDLTITGDVYITGDLTIGGAAKIKVADSVGTTRPVVVVDGKITVGGSGSITANSSGTGIYFISYKSAAACGASCTSLSGNDLYNSQNLETVNVGGAAGLPGILFQAYWGKATLAGSGNIGSVMGQTIDLSGAGTVVFGTSLSSGTSTWTIRSYQQMY